MAWENSDRKARLPDDWPALRAIVFKRCGGRCEERKANGRRCWDKATDCDHIIPGDDHSLENLRGLCRWHHARKSSKEGVDARAAAASTLARKPEPHPNLLPPELQVPLSRKGF